MSQTTLGAFATPQTSLPLFGDNSCTDCVNRRGPIQVIGGKRKVRCLIRLKDARDRGCASWSNGRELEYMNRCRPPADFIPKKWAGRMR